jgi:hypothetical protein
VFKVPSNEDMWGIFFIFHKLSLSAPNAGWWPVYTTWEKVSSTHWIEAG